MLFSVSEEKSSEKLLLQYFCWSKVTVCLSVSSVERKKVGGKDGFFFGEGCFVVVFPRSVQ